MKQFILAFALVSLSVQADAQRSCSAVTNMIHVGTPWVDVINLSYSQTSVTFYTNFVCGASNYTWIMDGLYSITTATPSLTMSAQDFVLFAPATGCTGFNSKLTLPWPGSDYGIYNTSMSVKSDITNLITIPVRVSNVRKCYTGTEKQKTYIGN